MRLCALLSSGKDSVLAADLVREQGHELACALTMLSENPFSYMFHTPNARLASLQAEAMGVPIILQPTKGEEEKELEDLDAGLLRAVNEFKAQGVVSGALKSWYQRYRIDKACMKYALGVYAPLWKMDEAKEAELLLSRGYKIVFSAVAAEGLDEGWLGKPFDRAAVERLRSLGVSLVGEGGEFETLVLDCPMFMKRLRIARSHAVKEGVSTARLVVDEALLEKK
jgi:asparagine synthase (glutamine-hydrolysing)